MADYFDWGTKSPQQYCAEIADFLQQHPHAWTRGVFATDADGIGVSPTSRLAQKFCALGLLMKFVRDRAMQLRCEQLLSRAVTPYGAAIMRSPANYNDTIAESVQDVIAMFRAASYLPDERRDSVDRAAVAFLFDWKRLLKHDVLNDPIEPVEATTQAESVAA